MEKGELDLDLVTANSQKAHSGHTQTHFLWPWASYFPVCLQICFLPGPASLLYSCFREWYSFCLDFLLWCMCLCPPLSRVCRVLMYRPSLRPYWASVKKTKFHLGALNTQFDSLVFHCLLPSIASCVCSPIGVHCLFLHVYESVHLCEQSISAFGAQTPFQVHRYSPSPQRWNQGLFFLDEVLKVYVSFISRVFPPQLIPRM